MLKYTGEIHHDFEKATTRICELESRIFDYQQQVNSLQQSVKYLEEAKESQHRKYKEKLAEKDAIIKKLSNEIKHLQAINNHDGTNTGIPTSQTPINKKKVIPNSREKSNKPKGGQKGHEKHSLKEPDENEVTDIVEHDNKTDGFICPNCASSNYIPTGESEVKFEYDVEINVKKIKHVFYYYKCMDCGIIFRSSISPQLKEKAQYGNNIQALALSLMNTANVPMNKIAMLISGISKGQLTPCEGYIAKLQGRAAQKLEAFKNDLYRFLINQSLIYWDDTVISINTKRACMRFYGCESIAYYTAHEHKDMASLDDDKILESLTAETKLMHDHNKVNYNDKYSFSNIECNQHLQRDCQKNSDDTCHTWSSKLKQLIRKTIHDRKKLINRKRQINHI